MTIELPQEIETQLKDRARAQGVSVGRYIGTLVTESSERSRQVSEFRSAIADRVASLDAGNAVKGEEGIARVIAELEPR